MADPAACTYRCPERGELEHPWARWLQTTKAQRPVSHHGYFVVPAPECSLVISLAHDKAEAGCKKPETDCHVLAGCCNGHSSPKHAWRMGGLDKAWCSAATTATHCAAGPQPCAMTTATQSTRCGRCPKTWWARLPAFPPPMPDALLLMLSRLLLVGSCRLHPVPMIEVHCLSCPSTAFPLPPLSCCQQSKASSSGLKTESI